MISVKINNVEFSVKAGISILEACKYVGVTVPRFCYHELLSVAGNCRMCLVEVEPFEKPVASCVAEVEDNMSVRIDTPFVKKARENVMEILLLNHPLDCPICDQAGECDLQDQAKVFGGTFSRNFFNRKGVEDKYCGPLIKTIMTRCIACTRCVRFGSEIAGIDYFGTLNRGGSTEIGNYIQKMFTSEISGNVIDLCPVGALTARPYAFKARPWELRVVETIDTTDSLGSSIYVNFKETEIFRVLPKSNNKGVLSTIISDATRFSYDSNIKNRIHSVYERNLNQYNKSKWEVTFNNLDLIVTQNKKQVNFFIDEELDLESLLHIKHLKFSKNYKTSVATRSLSEFSNIYVSSNDSLKRSTEKMDKVTILIGTNLKSESAVLNTKIRIQASKQYIKLYHFGNSVKDNLASTFLHFSTTKIVDFFKGKNLSVCQSILQSSSVFTIIGSSFRYKIKDFSTFASNINNLCTNFNLLILENSSNSIGLNWSNVSPSQNLCEEGVNVGINLSDSSFSRDFFNKKSQKNSIWLNTHGSVPASQASWILPTKTNFETESFFLNQEHTFQKTNSSVSSPSNARATSQIVKSIFQETYEYRYYDHMFEQAKKKITNNSKISLFFKKSVNNLIGKLSGISSISTYPIKLLQKDLYLSNNFSKNSTLMLKSSEEAKQLISNFN